MTMRAISLAYGTKVTDTVATSATTAKLVGRFAGPIQLRLENLDSVAVAYRFGGSSVTAVFAKDPVLPAGGVEVITAAPEVDGNVYMSVIGDTGAAGKSFGATPAQGI